VMKQVSVFVALVLFLVVSAIGGESLQVLQPNATACSDPEVVALSQGITDLKQILNDYQLASRRYFGAEDWLSQDFSTYTAGTLANLGYEVRIAYQDNWPNGEHSWVLAGILIQDRTVWIPVEASPEPDHSQQNLGYIPYYTDDMEKLWFEARYCEFDDVVGLAPNVPPVANIRLPIWSSKVGELIKLTALGAYDSDGEIVLYCWDFSDRKTTISTVAVCRHRFSEQGSYTITLTVIDNQGESATTSDTLRILVEDSEATLPSSSGCGCGG